MAAKDRKQTPPDEVDRAVAGVRRAVGRLVRLLGQEGMDAVRKAAVALAEIGPFAVGPLAAALPKAAVVHRLNIVEMLIYFGGQARGPVMEALARARQRDRDPIVRAKAAAALMHLSASGVAADLAAGASGPRAPVAAR